MQPELVLLSAIPGNGKLARKTDPVEAGGDAIVEMTGLVAGETTDVETGGTGAAAVGVTVVAAMGMGDADQRRLMLTDAWSWVVDLNHH